MVKKISAALLMIFMLTGGAAQAYDLPKIKPDKKVATSAAPDKGPVIKSDWKSADLFEQKMRARLAEGKPLAPDDPARIAADPNYVFVAFYNDAPFFLDRYSVKIHTTKDGSQVWEQKIFPITKKFSPTNATAVHQTFRLADGKFYNSSKAKDALADVPNQADKIFLTECANVGYRFAFGHAADVK